MTNAMGMTITQTATPSITQASRQPYAATSACAIGVTITPPSEMPVAAIATAMPRLRTNHLETVTFTTRLPMPIAPTVKPIPRNR